MQQNNQDKQEQARHLYFAQAKTQKEIAQMLNICEKTVYNWIRRFSWDQMRQAARQAPALISENLCSHIVELQNSIARREPGLRYPTAEEALTMQRLITMLDKMKKYPGLSMNMQVIGTFRDWASTRDKSFSRDLGLYSGLFLQGYAKNGYYPYELEFGMDKINPIDPYYEHEPAGEKAQPKECHPELAEGQKPNEKNSSDDDIAKPINNVIPTSRDIPAPKDPEPVEGLPNDENLNSPKDNNLAEPTEQPGLSSGMSSRACRGAVNPPSESIQNIEDQNTYPDNKPLPAPVKTGKNQVIDTPSEDIPWHNWLRKQNENDPILNTKQE